jgi:protein involved in polysaccharide export with SLBB domain
MKPGSNGDNGKRRKDNGAARTGSSLTPVGRLPFPARRGWRVLAASLLFTGGCLTGRAHVEHNLMSDRGMTAQNEAVAKQYTVGCPDVLEIRVLNRPDLGGRFTVGPQGRIELAQLGRPRVEGRTPPQIATMLAKQAHVPLNQVRVRVADYESQEVYLFGQVTGLQRAVAYQGQETVLDLLQRTGGITPGAAPDDVYVIRTRVAEGQRPEVFHVDLHAIVLQHDQHTNIRLQPFDQIHVGETRQARVERNMPPWIRPLYETLSNTTPPGKAAESK